MLIDAHRSCLFAVDLQEKLVPALHESGQLTSNCLWLLQIARRLQIPIVMSEQYPRGLGHTLPQLRDPIPPEAILEKTCFSCTEEEHFRAHIGSLKRDQWIVIGAEAHVCVLQTALGLLQADYEVYVVADCTASRDPVNRELALRRLRHEGVRVVSREMVAFEWLYRAGTDTFREVSREFLR